MDGFGGIMTVVAIVAVVVSALMFVWSLRKAKLIDAKSKERSLKFVPLLIHLPPTTDDVNSENKDKRVLAEEEISQAEAMYEIIASTYKNDKKAAMYGQKALSFEIVAKPEGVEYYAIVPVSLIEIIKQAISASYPTARLEEVDDPNIFNPTSGRVGTVGGELSLRKSFVYPIATYRDTKKDSALAILNVLSAMKAGDGAAIQLLIRPAGDKWLEKSKAAAKAIKDGKKVKNTTGGIGESLSYLFQMFSALWKPPDTSGKKDGDSGPKPLSNLQQAEMEAIEGKVQHPGFETLIRVVASSSTRPRAEMLLSGMVAVFSQFTSQQNNGFKFDALGSIDDVATGYIFRAFPRGVTENVLNSVELASIFHLPSQAAIPTSKVKKQMFRQVDGPSELPEEGAILGVNEFRGEKKEIRIEKKDRRRHIYVIGGTGVGKSVFLHNIAYQDMMDGRGFAFIDPHGDAVETLMSMIPEERMDDVIYFDPGDMSNPIGMNMFEFTDPEQKDFIVQEGINMLYGLYDPGHTGIFGPRGEHIFRNAALLIMSDPEGGTFIDIPKVLIDADYRNAKLKYVTDRTVYDFWTKEWPASQKSNDAGEVTSWFVSKWGPFLSNTMMRNVMGQIKGGFNIREIMDNNKILLVNLSKGKMGELNSKLLGMIFVMKFQAAAMSRADIPEDERKDFCLFVDEFQNFSTESFESILSEARKYRLSLVLANQFMTQLTDKIREAIIGNIGTIIAGRIGVTDAELLQKAFTPVFNADDLHKLPNYQFIATVMIHNVPSSPFSMASVPQMGDGSEQLLKSLKAYSAAKYGRPRAEVDKEINERVIGNVVEPEPSAEQSSSFLAGWMDKSGAKSADTTVVNNTTQTEVNEATVVKNTAGSDESVVKSVNVPEKKAEVVPPAKPAPQVFAAAPVTPAAPAAQTNPTASAAPAAASAQAPMTLSQPGAPVAPKPSGDTLRLRIRDNAGDGSETHLKLR
jgi:hypothetical protein